MMLDMYFFGFFLVDWLECVYICDGNFIVYDM